MRSQEEYASDAVIIGAGPAGLAVAACLREMDVPFQLVEKGHCVGSAWHGHYDRLHLHTDKARSELPFVSYPHEYPRYPSRRQFIAYLEAYAERFELEPHFGRCVTSVRRVKGSWVARTEKASYRSRSLIVATGFTRTPYEPSWPGRDRFAGTVLHSSRYRNGEPFRGRNVLVVGFGNSGGEIALDLWEHGATPDLAVRSAVNIIPRDLFGWPILTIADLLLLFPFWMADQLAAPILWVLYRDLEQVGLRKLSYGPLTQIERDARIPLIDVGTVDLIRKRAISVRGGIERFDDEEIVFDDGSRERYDAVILATGYRPKVNAFLRECAGAVDEAGTPLRSGCEVLPGLFFCGFHVAPTGVLREIAREARAIAGTIAGRRHVAPDLRSPVEDDPLS